MARIQERLFNANQGGQHAHHRNTGDSEDDNESWPSRLLCQASFSFFWAALFSGLSLVMAVPMFVLSIYASPAARCSLSSGSLSCSTILGVETALLCITGAFAISQAVHMLLQKEPIYSLHSYYYADLDHGNAFHTQQQQRRRRLQQQQQHQRGAHQSPMTGGRSDHGVPSGALSSSPSPSQGNGDTDDYSIDGDNDDDMRERPSCHAKRFIVSATINGMMLVLMIAGLLAQSVLGALVWGGSLSCSGGCIPIPLLILIQVLALICYTYCCYQVMLCGIVTSILDTDTPLVMGILPALLPDRSGARHIYTSSSQGGRDRRGSQHEDDEDDDDMPLHYHQPQLQHSYPHRRHGEEGLASQPQRSNHPGPNNHHTHDADATTVYSTEDPDVIQKTIVEYDEEINEENLLAQSYNVTLTRRDRRLLRTLKLIRTMVEQHCVAELSCGKFFIFDQKHPKVPVIPIAMILDKDPVQESPAESDDGNASDDNTSRTTTPSSNDEVPGDHSTDSRPPSTDNNHSSSSSPSQTSPRDSTSSSPSSSSSSSSSQQSPQQQQRPPLPTPSTHTPRTNDNDLDNTISMHRRGAASSSSTPVGTSPGADTHASSGSHGGHGSNATGFNPITPLSGIPNNNPMAFTPNSTPNDPFTSPRGVVPPQQQQQPPDQLASDDGTGSSSHATTAATAPAERASVDPPPPPSSGPTGQQGGSSNTDGTNTTEGTGSNAAGAPATAVTVPPANRNGLPSGAPFKLQQRIATYRWMYIHLSTAPITSAGPTPIRPVSMLFLYRIKRFSPQPLALRKKIGYSNKHGVCDDENCDGLHAHQTGDGHHHHHQHGTHDHHDKSRHGHGGAGGRRDHDDAGVCFTSDTPNAPGALLAPLPPPSVKARKRINLNPSGTRPRRSHESHKHRSSGNDSHRHQTRHGHNHDGDDTNNNNDGNPIDVDDDDDDDYEHAGIAVPAGAAKYSSPSRSISNRASGVSLSELHSAIGPSSLLGRAGDAPPGHTTPASPSVSLAHESSPMGGHGLTDATTSQTAVPVASQNGHSGGSLSPLSKMALTDGLPTPIGGNGGGGIGHLGGHRQHHHHHGEPRAPPSPSTQQYNPPDSPNQEDDEVCILCQLSLWPDQYEHYKQSWVEVSNKPFRRAVQVGQQPQHPQSPTTDGRNGDGSMGNNHQTNGGTGGGVRRQSIELTEQRRQQEQHQSSSQHGSDGGYQPPPYPLVHEHRQDGDGHKKHISCDNQNAATTNGGQQPHQQPTVEYIYDYLPIGFGEVVSICASSNHCLMHSACCEDWLYFNAVSQTHVKCPVCRLSLPLQIDVVKKVGNSLNKIETIRTLMGDSFINFTPPTPPTHP